jgi:hypothetical protein
MEGADGISMAMAFGSDELCELLEGWSGTEVREFLLAKDQLGLYTTASHLSGDALCRLLAKWNFEQVRDFLSPGDGYGSVQVVHSFSDDQLFQLLRSKEMTAEQLENILTTRVGPTERTVADALDLKFFD